MTKYEWFKVGLVGLLARLILRIVGYEIAWRWERKIVSQWLENMREAITHGNL